MFPPTIQQSFMVPLRIPTILTAIPAIIREWGWPLALVSLSARASRITGGAIATGAAGTSTSITTITLTGTATGTQSTTVQATATASGSIIQIIAAPRRIRTGRHRTSSEATIAAAPIAIGGRAATGTIGPAAIVTRLRRCQVTTGPGAIARQRTIGRVEIVRRRTGPRRTIGH